MNDIKDLKFLIANFRLMLRVVTYEEIDHEAWSALVRESRTGTWFQSPEAYALFASMPELFRPFAIGIYRENINTDKPSYAAINIDKEEVIKNAHSTSAMPDGPRGLERNQPQTPTSELAASVDANTPNMLPECSTLNACENATPSPENGKKGELRGVCVGYVTKEKSRLKQYFTRRAIILGGPVIADDCSDEEVYSLMYAVRQRLKIEDCRLKISRGPIYIETRNFNDYSQWKEAFERAGFEYRKHLNYHIDTSSEEVVEANLGKSRKRDIRTTIREGVTVVSISGETKTEINTVPAINTDKEEVTKNVDSINSQKIASLPKNDLSDAERERLVHEYYLILKNLYETKVRLPLFPEKFFQTLAKHKDGRFLLTMKDGKVIGGTACVVLDKELKNSGVMYEWFACGEDGVYPHVFPSSLATYAGIKYAAEHGCERFDMMGAGNPNESYGVRDFKAKFGGQEVEHGRFIAINNEWLYRIGALGVSAMQRESWLLSAEQKPKEIIPGRKEWSQFVAHHPQGTIFQTPEMYAVYEQTRHQKPIVVSVKREGKIAGLLLAVVQWNGGELAKPLTARSIIIGGPLVKDNDKEVLRELMAEYQRRVPGYVVYSEIRPVYEIVNSEELIVNSAGWKRVGHYNLVLRVDKSEEELWNGMHKERRRNVGQAEKAELRFEEVRTEEGRKAVIALLQKTYARKRVPMADSSLFERLAELMPKNVHFFAAYHEDKMIAGQIRLGYKDLLYAWYAGSDEQYFKLRPNDFLMWNVIKWAHTQGYMEFDFGGGGEPGKPYGVRDYKLKYGCEMKDYGRWICVKRPIIYGMAKQMYAILHKE